MGINDENCRLLTTKSRGGYQPDADLFSKRNNQQYRLSQSFSCQSIESALSQIDAKQNVTNVTADKVAKVLLLSSYPVDLRKPIKYPSAEVDDDGHIHRTEIVAPQITIYWDQDKTHLFACAQFPEDRKGEIIGVYDL